MEKKKSFVSTNRRGARTRRHFPGGSERIVATDAIVHAALKKTAEVFCTFESSKRERAVAETRPPPSQTVVGVDGNNRPRKLKNVYSHGVTGVRQTARRRHCGPER